MPRKLATLKLKVGTIWYETCLSPRYHDARAESNAVIYGNAQPPQRCNRTRRTPAGAGPKGTQLNSRSRKAVRQLYVLPGKPGMAKARTPRSKRDIRPNSKAVFNRFREDFLLYTYSLVGFDSKADLMFWRIGTSLDLIQE